MSGAIAAMPSLDWPKPAPSWVSPFGIISAAGLASPARQSCHLCRTSSAAAVSPRSCRYPRFCPSYFCVRLALPRTERIVNRGCVIPAATILSGLRRTEESDHGLDWNHACQISARWAALCKRYHRPRVGGDRIASAAAGRPWADPRDQPARCCRCHLLHCPIGLPVAHAAKGFPAVLDGAAVFL